MDFNDFLIGWSAIEGRNEGCESVEEFLGDFELIFNAKRAKK